MSYLLGTSSPGLFLFFIFKEKPRGRGCSARRSMRKTAFNKNDRDQVLWARETEHPTHTLAFTKPVDATTWLRSLLSKVFHLWGGKLILGAEPLLAMFHLGEQGWRSGESPRIPPTWPGFKSRRRRHMWIEFVVGSLPCYERFFSGYSGFPLSPKTNTSKFQFDL